jgi:hypothetical protein
MNGWKQNVTWAITAICSGLGGAIFTYLMLTRSTVIEYTINRTALGSNETAVVPNIKVGDTNLKSLYIYSIKLQYASGFELEKANIGIELVNPSVKSVGTITPESPSQVFPVSCEQFKYTPKSVGTTCSFGRFGTNVGTYTVSFATDIDTDITLHTDAKNTQLRQAGVVGAGNNGFSSLSIIFPFLIGAAIALFISLIFHRFPNTSDHIQGEGDALSPKLSIDYKGAPANKTEARFTKNDGVTVDEIYIRVRVRNLGKQTAKGARVFLTDLHEVQNGIVSQKSFVWDSLQLGWAGWDFDPKDVPQGVSFYADVMRVSKQTSGWLLSVQKMRLANDADLVHYSGTLRFQVTVTADNAAPASCELDVIYNQDWHSLRAVPVGKSSSESNSLS